MRDRYLIEKINTQCLSTHWFNALVSVMINACITVCRVSSISMPVFCKPHF